MKRKMLKRFFIIILVFAGLYSTSYSQDKELRNFWKSFQTAVIEKKDSTVIKLTYFFNEDTKQKFNFDYIFDENIRSKFKNFSIYDLEKAERVHDELNDNPFDILSLPDDIKEAYILTVGDEYEEEESLIAMDIFYIFGKIEGKFKFLGFYTAE